MIMGYYTIIWPTMKYVVVVVWNRMCCSFMYCLRKRNKSNNYMLLLHWFRCRAHVLYSFFVFHQLFTWFFFLTIGATICRTDQDCIFPIFLIVCLLLAQMMQIIMMKMVCCVLDSFWCLSVVICFWLPNHRTCWRRNLLYPFWFWVGGGLVCSGWFLSGRT